jgi:1-phosphatidylinositol-3-phosphate 5-kinase
MSSLGRSSASSSTSSFKFFGSSHKPDPDREDSVWDEPEAYSAVVTRKEHPRDPTALLSLREVLRHKVPVDGPQNAQPSSSSITVSRMTNSNAAPPSAWAKPAVEVNMAAVDGKVTGMPEAVLTAGRILHELDGASVLSSKGSTDSAASGFIETNVHRGKTSSILSRVSLENLNGIGAAPHHHAVLGDRDKYVPVPVPVPPAQRGAAPPERERANKPLLVDPRSRSSTTSTTQDSIDRDRESEAAATNASDSIILSWTSSLTNAMRYMLKADLPSQPGATPPAKNHHGLLYADPMTIDERPHIKYDWTIGKRLKFSCTVYYAKQFDALRRRCGVEDVFVRSMAKCEPWKAQGGKSRSNFWKTSDDRFIIKTLVNAWNVADLYVGLLFLFLSDGHRLTALEQKKKPSSHRPRTLVFPAYGFDSGSSVYTRETARLLYYRSSQLGDRDRAGKGGSSRDGEFILQPKAFENVRP